MNLPATTSPQLAWKAWRNLHGFFAVYKPAGLPAEHVKQMIQTALLEDLNKLPSRPQRSLVKLVKDVARVEENPGALTAVQVPSYADHPLVRGPLYTAIKVAVVSSGVDAKMSGVMVMAVKQGTREIDPYRAARMPRTYAVRGRFGIATDTHDDQGKIWQKSKYHHVTREKFDRVISNLQRSHQKVMISNAGVELQSQEAYELAVRSQLRPFGSDLPPLILNMRCLEFDPPDFQLEMECIKENAQYLRKTVHELAQELRTCAVATHVRRTQDGPFSLDQSLLRSRWTLPDIAQALQASGPLVRGSVAKVRAETEAALTEAR